jgi:hypothetical protein
MLPAVPRAKCGFVKDAMDGVEAAARADSPAPRTHGFVRATSPNHPFRSVELWFIVDCIVTSSFSRKLGRRHATRVRQK